MSVNPGFGGQSFIPTSMGKLRRLRRMVDDGGYAVRIEIDGGIGPENISDVIAAGAEIVVAGSAVFGGGHPAESVKELIEKGTVWV
jgi:ribulose-phosphate 3-epimerase